MADVKGSIKALVAVTWVVKLVERKREAEGTNGEWL